MADNDARYGLRIHSTLSGSGTPVPEVMVVATGYQGSLNSTDVDINIGDPIKRVAAGTAQHCDAGDDIYGVCVGIKQYWDGTVVRSGPSLPGATAWGTVEERRSEILVVRADQCVWEIDCDDKTTATTLPAYRLLQGTNADFAYGGADAATDKAHPRLDISDAATSEGTMRIVGVSPTPFNVDFSGLYVKLLVIANNMATQIPSGGGEPGV